MVPVSVLGSAGSARLRRQGWMPQDPTVCNDLRVIDNITSLAELCGVARQAADEVIENSGPARSPHRHVPSLSGQRGRVSLACALVGRPDR